MNALHPSIQRKNFYHLVQNQVWMGLAMSATTRFLSVYAIRLGATPLELGLMASLPAIFTMLAATLAGWWMRQYRTTAQAMRWPAFGLRLNFPLLILAPLLPQHLQAAWLILAMSVPAVPAGVQSVIFLVAVREAVNQKFLTPLISRRHMVMNMAVGVSTLVFGIWLEHIVFPLNYQIMFVAGFGLALVGWWHLNNVRTLPAVTAITEQVRSTGSRIWQSDGFQSVALIAIITHIGWFALIPVTPLRLVNELGAGETFIALYSMAELAASALMALFASAVARRIGHGGMISLAMVGTALSAGVLALAPALPLTLIAAVVGGIAWTAAGISLFGLFSERTTPEPRATTLYMQIISLATFVGPLLGSSLANAGFDLVWVLAGGALLRLAAATVTHYCVQHKIQLIPTRFSRLAQR